MKKTLLPLIILSSTIAFPLVKANEPLPLQGPVQASLVFNEQSTYFISSNSVRVRSTPDSSGKILGELSLNDKVKIINPETIYNGKFIEITIVQTYDPIVKSEKYFTNIESLSPKFIDYKEFVGKYFVVVNVATETLRLYERVCADNSCPNKMIMETEVVVGEDIDHPKEEKGKGRSILGSYRVTGWSKFYQDPEGHYPAWYRDGYPDIPGPDSSWNEWFSRKVMPLDEHGKHIGKMRGAFGWYTAFVAPEPFGQWTHGTLGWGADKDKYIQKVKKTLINVVSDPRSSGCTRNNNEAIAFLRQMIDVGAPIIKIYAKEDILDPALSNYPEETAQWNYIMTKNRNHSADRAVVMKSLGINDQDLNAYLEVKRTGGELILDPQSPLGQIIEVGTYDRDTHPDAIAFTAGEKLNKLSRAVGRKGNVYGIKSTEMHGTFYVDAGLLDGYAHPDSVLEFSGFMDEMTPPWMALSNLKK
ncbi:MAG: L,D-transpeptidase family protein [Bacteriovorax sp.]